MEFVKIMGVSLKQRYLERLDTIHHKKAISFSRSNNTVEEPEEQWSRKNQKKTLFEEVQVPPTAKTSDQHQSSK